ncbi:MAG: formate dehydrogenase subunit gamma [Thauera phenolivorans]|uniref:Formate dehydrogenase subunit gamma n=1 Tax=Thauera phenolivorans TaxID=1792543 RepID=A0A7X7LTZ6_9RHOO|nr:formate dehydrogenase subunit gamma [Thauera phenolivorans]
MKTIFRRDKWPLLLVLVFWLLALLVAATPVHAQRAAHTESSAEAQAERQAERPGNNAPVWRAVRSGEAHFTTVRGPETGVLIQNEGNTWRQLRNGPVTVWGGWLLILVPAAILLFWLVKGTIRLHAARTGRKITRFSGFERFVHWGTAISFVLLALTGFAILFGKHVLAPLFGGDLLALLLSAGKLVHNYIGPLFGVFLLMMFFTFVRDNLWHPSDATWIRRGGGLLGGDHVPSGRFNFGEKSWFWFGVTLLGLAVSISGLVMDFPNFGQGRADMQIANIVHAVGATLLLALAFGHIYMGTLGAEGAFEAMSTGEVDETWAKEHHALWYEEVKAGKSGRG